MWKEGIERNIRSFEEAVKRQSSSSEPYGRQAYHALTWVPYGFQQQGENQKARDYIAKIAKQVEQYGEGNAVHRNHYATTRASYLVDTQDWESELADVRIDHTGLSKYALTADRYAQALVAINRGKLDVASDLLAKMKDQQMDGDSDAMGAMGDMAGMVMTSGKRADVAPGLLRLALEGQIKLAEGNKEAALTLIQQAEKIEGALPSEYGPAVPVQPMAELLADVYADMGNNEMAKQYYQTSLERAVGRVRSLNGLKVLEGRFIAQ